MNIKLSSPISVEYMDSIILITDKSKHGRHSVGKCANIKRFIGGIIPCRRCKPYLNVNCIHPVLSTVS
jgi:hypothetical protein